MYGREADVARKHAEPRPPGAEYRRRGHQRGALLPKQAAGAFTQAVSRWHVSAWLPSAPAPPLIVTGAIFSDLWPAAQRHQP